MTVSIIVPTYNRADRHAQLYAVFSRQSAPADLWILDDSPVPSPFFSTLRDPHVHYFHTTKRLSIGTKRNLLVEACGGDIIVQFDDDDLYTPGYIATMVPRLGDGDLVKLTAWDAISEYDGSIWRWDTTRVLPIVYRVTGSAPPVIIRGMTYNAETADTAEWGYGFSYVFRRDAWKAVGGFDDMNSGEDIAFIRKLRKAGKKLMGVADHPDMVLHTMHRQSTSRIYPQWCLKNCGPVAEAEIEMQSQTAAVLSGTALAEGQKIPLVRGATYDVVANVKHTHTRRQLEGHAGSLGVRVMSLDENLSHAGLGLPAPKLGYRYVRAKLHVGPDAASHLPWKVPLPWSLDDKTRVVRAQIVSGHMVGATGSLSVVSFAVVSLALFAVGVPVAIITRILGASWLRAALYGVAASSVVVLIDAFAAPRMAREQTVGAGGGRLAP